MPPRPPDPDASGGATVRASEIGTFLFCERAWWYGRSGIAARPTPAMESGLAWHRFHGRRALTADRLRRTGWILIAAGLMLAAASLVATRIG